MHNTYIFCSIYVYLYIIETTLDRVTVKVLHRFRATSQTSERWWNPHAFITTLRCGRPTMFTRQMIAIIFTSTIAAAAASD